MSITEQLPEIRSFIHNREFPHTSYSPEMVSPNLVEIADRLAILTGKWNPVEIYTPSKESLDQQKKLFLAAFEKGEVYTPVFDYKTALNMDVQQARIQIQQMLDEVRRHETMTQQDRLFHVALYAKLHDDLATCDLIDGIKSNDEAKIKDGMERKYPKSDAILFEYAHHAFDELITPSVVEGALDQPLLSTAQQEVLKKTICTPEQTKEAFEWILSKYGILRDDTHPIGFKVVISDDVTAIDVRDKSDSPMTIFVPRNRNAPLTADKLLALMAHEIEGHARQSINGMLLFKIGGGPLKIDDETLYEGLAMGLEESIGRRFFGEISGIPTPWYALAIEKAEQGGSFAQIFQDQYERQLRVLLKIPTDQQLNVDVMKHPDEVKKAKTSAWSATYRVLRGHTDMDNKLEFAMCKDLGYLRGWIMDKQLRELGDGGFNEMAISQTGGLQLLARLGMEDIPLPHPYQDFTKTYCLSVLLPKLDPDADSIPGTV